MAAYRRPKATDEEKAGRTAAIQAALKVATAAPLDVMRSCAAALEQAVVVASIGNPSASSDVLVGIELLVAGLKGAKANVEINLGSIKDALTSSTSGRTSSNSNAERATRRRRRARG